MLCGCQRDLSAPDPPRRTTGRTVEDELAIGRRDRSGARAVNQLGHTGSTRRSSAQDSATAAPRLLPQRAAADGLSSAGAQCPARMCRGNPAWLARRHAHRRHCAKIGGRWLAEQLVSDGAYRSALAQGSHVLCAWSTLSGGSHPLCRALPGTGRIDMVGALAANLADDEIRYWQVTDIVRREVMEYRDYLRD